jgi:predicted nucleic acid-binding protein
LTAFLDTNVLLYAVSRVPADAEKRERAWTLIDGGGLALSMQVLQEFYYQATRPTRIDTLTDEEAMAFVGKWRRFPVQETTLALLDLGFELQRRHRFSFWDSMIVAAARAQGCEMLWTEDMDDRRIVDGTRIANPFRCVSSDENPGPA